MGLAVYGGFDLISDNNSQPETNPTLKTQSLSEPYDLTEEFLYIHTSKTGTLESVDIDQENWKLTLREPNPQIGYFSDRPYRDAGDMSFDSYISQVFAGNQPVPNADLTFMDKHGNQYSFQVILNEPVIENNTILYNLSFLVMPDFIPSTLFDVNLFVDDGGDSCDTYVDSTDDLTIDKVLTHPKFTSKHYTTISEYITAGEGDFTGETTYQWSAVDGQTGPSFNLYYTADNYDAEFHLHTHCASMSSGDKVKKVSSDMKGKDSILFSVKHKKDFPPGADGHGQVGTFHVIKNQDTGLWFELTLPDGDVTDTHSSFQITLADGDDYFTTQPNRDSAWTPAHTGDRTVQVCDASGGNCATDTITLDTTTVPVLSCEYDYNFNMPDDVPELSCTQSQGSVDQFQNKNPEKNQVDTDDGV